MVFYKASNLFVLGARMECHQQTLCNNGPLLYSELNCHLSLISSEKANNASSVKTQGFFFSAT